MKKFFAGLCALLLALAPVQAPAQLLLTGVGVRGSSSATKIQDVFAINTYAGNGAVRTMSTLDLSGGGLVWAKERNGGGGIQHALFDTARGPGAFLQTNSTAAATTAADQVTAFGSSGYTLGADAAGYTNASGINYVNWAFKKAPKFFDVISYTGTGSPRTIAHSLGTAPGMIVVKKVNAAGTDWTVYHKSLGNYAYVFLNSTGAVTGTVGTPTTLWNGTDPTSTVFSLDGNDYVNGTAATYVAYVFADDSTADGLIRCSSFLTDGSGDATITLGWEPQYLISRNVAGGSWYINDQTRGWTGAAMKDLFANSAGVETNDSGFVPTGTGFTYSFGANATYIYCAIRKGPM